MADYVIAIDQGTTSSRAIIFDRSGSIVSVGQKEHEQIMPHAGWVEHDATDIWQNVQEVIGSALGRADITRHDIATIAIGTFTSRHHRQLAYSVSTPPSTRPTAAPPPAIAP